MTKTFAVIDLLGNEHIAHVCWESSIRGRTGWKILLPGSTELFPHATEKGVYLDYNGMRYTYKGEDGNPPGPW